MHLLESVSPVIGTAAVAPALLVLWLVIATDERPASPVQVWLAFAFGAASITVLGLVRAPFAALAALHGDAGSGIALHALFGIAFPEEIVKIVAIVAIASWRRPLDDPMDAVIYGAAVGLGFAAYENLVYLARFPEMWRSLALLRSVLTVPFHGALGVIAGAYLAIARAGLALGAHRQERGFARNRARLSIIAIPVLLHAAFDLPLLVLQRHPELGEMTSLVLEAASMVIGFGTIALAGRLVWRVGIHHAPRTELARARLRHLRGMWALLVGGGGAGFAGFAFILSWLRRWSGAEPDITASLAPAGIASIAVGALLLTLTAAVYFHSRNRLNGSGAGHSAFSVGD